MPSTSRMFQLPFIDLANQLRRGLSTSCNPGDFLPSLKALADQHGRTTEDVEMALAVLHYAGYVVTTADDMLVMGNASPRNVAIVAELDLTQPRISFFSQRLYHSIHRFLEEMHVPSRLYVGEDALLKYGSSLETYSNQQFVNDLANDRINGIIALDLSPSLQDRIVAAGLPLVNTKVINDQNLIHYPTMACLGLDHLIDHGCERIAMLDHGSPSTTLTSGQAALRKALAARQLPIHEEWLITTCFKHGQQAGADAFRRLWTTRTEKPDGLIVLDDMLYRDLGPLLLYHHIRVPDDLCIISHVNKEDERPMIPLPALLQVDPDAVAMAMGYALIAELRQTPITENLPPALSLIEEPGPGYDFTLG